MTCQECEKTSTFTCIKCGASFCPDHLSPLDEEYCINCLTMKSAETRDEPLVDEEGVTHKGRHIIVTGEIYQTQARAISDRTDEELEIWITHYQELVRDAEKTLEYRRIMKGILLIERADRQSTASKILARIRIPAGARKHGGVTLRSTTAPQKLAAALKAAGVTKEMLEGIIAAKMGVKK